MINILRKIGLAIEKVAREEDAHLRGIAEDRGVFYMPELAFVYACGKSIMLDRVNVFGDLGVTWRREENVGSGGPTDLLFELSNGKHIAIEFKLGDSFDSYLRDIKKLSLLDQSKYICAFCALVDVSTNKLPSDSRIDRTDAIPDVHSLLEPKPNFPTNYSKYGYASKISCVVCLWGVGNEF